MEFNESQKIAIEHGDGPMLLLAGPGSGKTTVLIHRIKYMIQHHGIRPEHILVITFTKAAANEMKIRFRNLCPEVGSVPFGTFPSGYLEMPIIILERISSRMLKNTEQSGIA